MRTRWQLSVIYVSGRSETHTFPDQAKAEKARGEFAAVATVMRVEIAQVDLSD